MALDISIIFSRFSSFEEESIGSIQFTGKVEPETQDPEPGTSRWDPGPGTRHPISGTRDTAPLKWGPRLKTTKL